MSTATGIPYGRRTGKTTALVLLLRSDPDVGLIVFSTQEAFRIRFEFRLTASEARRVVAYRNREVLRGRYRRVLVDEVGLIPWHEYHAIAREFEVVERSFSSPS